MAARRLVIVMLVLLGVSTLAAALIPTDSRLRQGSQTTETEEPAPTSTIPRGELLAATIEIGGRELPVVRVRLGDQLELTVCSERAGQVEIPRFGLLEHVDPFSPARFDILAREVGTFGIRLVGEEEVAGRIEVLERSSEAQLPERASPQTTPSDGDGGPGTCPPAPGGESNPSA